MVTWISHVNHIFVTSSTVMHVSLVSQSIDTAVASSSDDVSFMRNLMWNSLMSLKYFQDHQQSYHLKAVVLFQYVSSKKFSPTLPESTLVWSGEHWASSAFVSSFYFLPLQDYANSLCTSLAKVGRLWAENKCIAQTDSMYVNLYRPIVNTLLSHYFRLTA